MTELTPTQPETLTRTKELAQCLADKMGGMNGLAETIFEQLERLKQPDAKGAYKERLLFELTRFVTSIFQKLDRADSDSDMQPRSQKEIEAYMLGAAMERIRSDGGFLKKLLEIAKNTEPALLDSVLADEQLKQDDFPKIPE